MEGSQNGHTAPELPRVCQLLARVHKRIRRQGVPHAETDEQQRKEVRMERRISSCLREHEAGAVRNASSRHAYREGHVCS